MKQKTKGEQYNYYNTMVAKDYHGKAEVIGFPSNNGCKYA